MRDQVGVAAIDAEISDRTDRRWSELDTQSRAQWCRQTRCRIETMKQYGLDCEPGEQANAERELPHSGYPRADATVAVTNPPATAGRYSTGVFVLCSRSPYQSAPVRQAANASANNAPIPKRTSSTSLEYPSAAAAMSMVATACKTDVAALNRILGFIKRFLPGINPLQD